ncbi:MAG: oligosaccharide flippase family protein [Verrucomicrobia bacterium]|nr:oligosaccharide flippase family protein [Verrucomicrobiota bacterium]
MYGLAMLLGVVVSFAEIADMGLRMALGRNLAEALSVQDKEAYNRLASTAGAIWLSVGSLMALACVILAPAIVTFLDIPPEIQNEAIFLVRAFGGGSILLAFILPIFTAVLSSSNRFDIVNNVHAVQGVLTGLLLFLVISLTDYGIYAWAAVMFGIKILSISVQGVLARRLVPTLRLSPALVDRQSFHKLFSLSGYLFFLQLTNLLSMKADPIILSRFLGPAALALYNPGLSLSRQVRPLVQVLANQLYPVTTKFHATGDKKRMETTLFLGTRITLCMGIGVFAILGIFSQDICRVWLESTLGADYRIAGHVLLGWALVDLFQAAGGSQWAVLIGKNRVGFIVFLNFPLAVTNISASIYMVAYTGLGVVGVIIPTVVIGALRRIITTIYLCRVIECKILLYLREAYLRPFLLAVILVSGNLFVVYFYSARNLFDLVAMVAVSAIVWLLLSLGVGFKAPERGIVVKRIKAEIGKTPFFKNYLN